MADRDIELFLSGGATNTDKNASLGGVISATQITGNTLAYDVAAITGVTLLDSKGDVGTLHFINATTKIGLQKNGGAIPALAIDLEDVSVNGNYTLTCPEGDASITIAVVSASLPIADATEAVTPTKINPTLYNNVSESEAESGSIKYRHLYLFNSGATTINVNAYINPNYAGLDALSIGFFATSSGGSDDELLIDEDTAPLAVTFNAPSNVGDAITLTLDTSGKVGIYLKREVLALSDVSALIDTAAIVIELV